MIPQLSDICNFPFFQQACKYAGSGPRDSFRGITNCPLFLIRFQDLLRPRLLFFSVSLEVCLPLEPLSYPGGPPLSPGFIVQVAQCPEGRRTRPGFSLPRGPRTSLFGVIQVRIVTPRPVQQSGFPYLYSRTHNFKVNSSLWPLFTYRF